MKTPLLLLIVTLLLNLPVQAQQLPFEQQTVLLADGTQALLWISLDDKADLLHYKLRYDSNPEIYKPSDVESFNYAGQQYYTLPLRDGYFTFFKVYHEGKEFAVLEKAPSYKALRVIADESDGRYSLCQNKSNNRFYLCYKEVKGNSQLYDIRTYRYSAGPVTIGTSEFEVHKIVYLAIEGQLKLFYLETDERFNYWDNWMGPRPGKRRTEEMLEEFIEDKEKISAIQKKVKRDKLDIRFPPHLIIALEAVYH